MQSICIYPSSLSVTSHLQWKVLCEERMRKRRLNYRKSCRARCKAENWAVISFYLYPHLPTVMSKAETDYGERCFMLFITIKMIKMSNRTKKIHVTYDRIFCETLNLHTQMWNFNVRMTLDPRCVSYHYLLPPGLSMQLSTQCKQKWLPGLSWLGAKAPATTSWIHRK